MYTGASTTKGCRWPLASSLLALAVSSTLSGVPAGCSFQGEFSQCQGAQRSLVDRASTGSTSKGHPVSPASFDSSGGGWTAPTPVIQSSTARWRTRSERASWCTCGRTSSLSLPTPRPQKLPNASAGSESARHVSSKTTRSPMSGWTRTRSASSSRGSRSADLSRSRRPVGVSSTSPLWH